MNVHVNDSLAAGFRDGVPIGLGYLSVSVTFGMAAAAAGLPTAGAVLISMTNVTSAGQFAGLTLIAAGSSLIEMALTQLVINLRYALMSLSLSQRLGPEFTTRRRMTIAFANTDEIFAVAMGRKALLTPAYMYGLATLPILGWTLGTVSGAVASGLLNAAVRSALGVALYSMFVAIVVPPMRQLKSVRIVVAAAVIVSCLIAWVPLFKFISSGFAIILSTLAAAALGAWLFPVDLADEQPAEKQEASA